MLEELVLKDYKWMTYADVLRLSQLGLLKYANKSSHVFYVDFANGKDTQHSGRNFDAPLLTLTKAVSQVESGRGDFILIIPSAGTNGTDGDIALAKTDVVIAGLGDAAQVGVTIYPTTDPATAIIAATAAADRIVIKNIYFDGNGDGGADVVAINAIGGASNWIVEDCIFSRCGTGINGSNAATANLWKIRNNLFANCDSGIVGYFGFADIYNNKFIKTNTAALTVGISLLDNTTTANSDGALIRNNIILGGIEGTTPMADGIVVAAACYGVGVIENRVAGCTTNVTVTENTAASQSIFNLTGDGREGGGEWADAETYIDATA